MTWLKLVIHSPDPEFFRDLLDSSGSESPSLREPGEAWLSWPLLKAESVCVGGRGVSQMAPSGTGLQLCLSQVTWVGLALQLTKAHRY